MSTVEVEESHALSIPDAKKAVDVFAADQISKFGLKLDWKGDRADIKGAAASGEVVVTASKVKITVKLGMMAKMAGIDAGRLEGSIRKRLQTALTSGA